MTKYTNFILTFPPVAGAGSNLWIKERSEKIFLLFVHISKLVYKHQQKKVYDADNCPWIGLCSENIEQLLRISCRIFCHHSVECAQYCVRDCMPRPRSLFVAE